MTNNIFFNSSDPRAPWTLGAITREDVAEGSATVFLTDGSFGREDGNVTCKATVDRDANGDLHLVADPSTIDTDVALSFPGQLLTLAHEASYHGLIDSPDVAFEFDTHR